MFDLNERIASWRAELDEGVGPEARAELEEHLRCEIEALTATGLSEAEAFLVAERRLGSQRELAREFTKVDPAAVWRRRAQWMVLGALALQVVHALVDVAGTLAAWTSVEVGLQTWGTAVLQASVVVLVLAAVVGLGRRIARAGPSHGTGSARRMFRAALALVAAGALLWIGQRVLWVGMTRVVGPEAFGRMAVSRVYADWVAALLVTTLLIAAVPWLGRRRRTQ